MRCILPAFFVIVSAALPAFAEDKPELACEILSRQDGQTGKAHQIYIRNTSGQSIALASFVTNPQRIAPWKPTDTYDSPYIRGADPRYFPILTGEIIKASGRSTEIGQKAVQKIMEEGKWDKSNLVVLKPGDVISAYSGVTGEPPVKINMTFFRLAEGKFVPLPVNWISTPLNP